MDTKALLLRAHPHESGDIDRGPSRSTRPDCTTVAAESSRHLHKRSRRHPFDRYQGSLCLHCRRRFAIVPIPTYAP